MTDKKIFWGSAATAFAPNTVAGKKYQQVKNQEPFKTVTQALGIETLLLLRQTHSSQGLVITERDKELSLWTVEGDYLITQQHFVALAVVTADCLPVVIHDPITKTIAIVHAGWKGLFTGVVQQALQTLCDATGANIKNLECFVGPAARSCCYEIKSDFVEHIPDKQTTGALLLQGHKLMFDLATFLSEQLIKKGMQERKIDLSNALCTLCTGLFCSARNQLGGPLRQISAVSLK